MDIAYQVNRAQKLPEEEAGFLKKNSTRMWRQGPRAEWLRHLVLRLFQFLPIPFPSPGRILVPLWVSLQGWDLSSSFLCRQAPFYYLWYNTYFGFLCVSQILHRLTKRVLQLESILEGIVSQVDVVGSKLKMLESKGDLAPSPGMVSSFSWVLCSVREDSLERPGEQWSQWS